MKKRYSKLHYIYILTTTFLLVLNIKAQPFDGFIRFDGIDDELSISASTIFEDNMDFTIEFWFRTCQDTLTTHQAFLGNSNNIEVNMFPGLDKTFYQLCANSTNNVWTCFQDHQYPTDLDWHHIAVTYDNSLDQFEFYFDGIDGTVSTSHDYDFSTIGLLYIGRSGYQTWLYNNFNGYMDELRISNTIRYTSSFIPTLNAFIPDTHTRGLWHFNENILDYSGNDFHFSSLGNPEIIYFENVISELDGTLIALDGFDSYQWIDCTNNNLPVSNGMEQFFTPIKTGSYAVEVIENTCPLISDCFDITVTGLDRLINKSSINIYPNPTNSVIYIDKKTNDEMKIDILDNLGNLIFIGTSINESTSIDLNQFPAGIYIIRLKTKDGVLIEKISKI